MYYFCTSIELDLGTFSRVANEDTDVSSEVHQSVSLNSYALAELGYLF